jgi:hypothetical protein
MAKLYISQNPNTSKAVQELVSQLREDEDFVFFFIGQMHACSRLSCCCPSNKSLRVDDEKEREEARH